jgi:GR25 family glycosyltransferase involved in LPS biosynthesis
MLFQGFPRSSRNLILLIVVGFTLFFLFQVNSPIDGDYSFSWPGLGGLQVVDQDRNATLGVAKIYVLSLPNRSDRREDMDRLKKALGLRWGYVDAMDMKNQLVERIMNSVRAIRAKDSGSFIWPADMPPPNEHINPWNPEFLALSSKIPSSHPVPDDPMLCATNNNSVASDEPDPPEFRILTPARIACWYSHLSVIETVANDKSLKQDDAVIVLEDDVDMERDIHARLSHVRSYLPEEWDMLYLGK